MLALRGIRQVQIANARHAGRGLPEQLKTGNRTNVMSSFGVRMFADKADETAKAEGDAAAAKEEDAKAGGAPEADAEVKAEEDPEVKKLTEKIASLENDVKEAKDQVLRAFAEMENVRNRTKRDIENERNFANQKFAKSLLPTADNLSRALEAVPEAERSGPLYEGIQMTETELNKVFESNGISSFGVVGDKFDPQTHEAMMQVENPELDAGSVAFVMQRGYKFKERVLRPAQVGVVKASEK